MSQPISSELESLPLSAIVFDRGSRRVTFATTSACRLLTSTVGDVMGGRVDAWWSDPIAFRDWLSACEQAPSGSALPVHRATSATGTSLQVQYSALRVRDVCLVLSSSELAALPTSAAAGAAERQLAGQRLEALGTLAGGIAHDFNNMLTVIETHAGFLRRHFEPTHPERSNVEIVLHAAERAARLTSQLLAFSRRQIQELEVTNLNSIVHSLRQVMATTLGPNICLSVELGSAPLSCKVDVAQIEQVIINLMLNAKEAMPKGGTLAIRTSTVELGSERVPDTSALTEPGRYALLCIQDTGLGMDLLTRQRAFDPFFTTKDPLQSSGLGLSTVYGIVKQSGGYIWAESRLNQGTTLRVFLPLAEEESVPLTPRRTERVAVAKKHVLVVEDEPLVRRAARRILEREGCHVLEASDGVSALSLCRTHNETVDLVVTDMVMPNMSGRELAEQLVEKYPNVAVLFMSGYIDEVVVTRAMQARGALFLQKPFAPEALLRKVEQALSQRAALAPNQLAPTANQPI